MRRVLSLVKSDAGRYRVLRKMTWGAGFAEVGDVVKVDDPALARELVGCGKLEPVDDGAREHLGKPARWIEQPRNTAISSTNPRIFSRKSNWRQIT